MVRAVKQHGALCALEQGLTGVGAGARSTVGRGLTLNILPVAWGVVSRHAGFRPGYRGTAGCVWHKCGCGCGHLAEGLRTTARTGYCAWQGCRGGPDSVVATKAQGTGSTACAEQGRGTGRRGTSSWATGVAVLGAASTKALSSWTCLDGVVDVPVVRCYQYAVTAVCL